MASRVEEIWSALGAPAARTGLAGRRAPDLPLERTAYIALDGAGRRHLLVLLPDNSEPLVHRETRGLEVSTTRLQVGSNPEGLFVDLMCLDSAQNRTFAGLVDDILDVLRVSDAKPLDIVARTLARWRAFWSISSHGLSREEMLGLFGELWFLHRWLNATGTTTLNKWMASLRARHDFQWPEASVEVKTAATGAAEGPIHQISNLDQLDAPERGQLFLFSLQVVEDALASNSLQSLIASLTNRFRQDGLALTAFNDKLAAYGFDPARAEPQVRRFRIVAERLYRVGEDFPRLTRRSFLGGLPAGIGNVTYTISTSACEPWLIARSSADTPARFLRHE